MANLTSFTVSVPGLTVSTLTVTMYSNYGENKTHEIFKCDIEMETHFIIMCRVMHVPARLVYSGTSVKGNSE